MILLLDGVCIVFYRMGEWVTSQTCCHGDKVVPAAVGSQTWSHGDWIVTQLETADWIGTRLGTRIEE